MNSFSIKLGTRNSLLARSQSLQIAQLIEKNNPGLKIELVGIQTKGDQIQDIPLQKVEGKDFFVKELDEALLNGQVDLCVHSMKDLSLDRPHGITVAAIPERADPRDIVIFNEEVISKLQNGQEIRIGTSSPRRLENIPAFLSNALPNFGKKPILKFIEIRGNVNTRLSRIHLAESTEKKLDAVVLALAGLSRLQADKDAKIELAKLMQKTKIMVLPLSENPTAPAQGALSVECRTPTNQKDQEIFAAINKIHSQNTQISVLNERKILEVYGGGCHQRFGATQVNQYLFIKGKKTNGETCDEIRWENPKINIKNITPIEIFDGKHERSNIESHHSIPIEFSNFKTKNLFIAHHRALKNINNLSNFNNYRILCSGTSSWFELAKNGIWVEMSADSLGFDYLQNSLNSEFLNYQNGICVLTHSQGTESWKNIENCAQCIATYSLELINYSESTLSKLKSAKIAYWSSFSQFQELKKYCNKDIVHCTGSGKSATLIAKELSSNDRLNIFPNHKEWMKWLSTITKQM